MNYFIFIALLSYGILSGRSYPNDSNRIPASVADVGVIGPSMDP